MVSFPHCKINLGLHVVAKRGDGYHNIETCFYPVPRTDILEVIKADEFGFTASGLTVAGSVEDNLCVKAYRLLASAFKISPVKIHLHKILPIDNTWQQQEVDKKHKKAPCTGEGIRPGKD